ncbi:hypothetical protein NPIL_26801 [Nephila pilipes]|uniref:Uncharacterized protein n=1 Tax=Nephila pilipes TaxID=299642 RepID=A0A8X6UU95_NEPPI|nr:hypothetical protein NPIL_26801 [Nephila pilipes]
MKAESQRPWHLHWLFQHTSQTTFNPKVKPKRSWTDAHERAPRTGRAPFLRPQPFCRESLFRSLMRVSTPRCCLLQKAENIFVCAPVVKVRRITGHEGRIVFRFGISFRCLKYEMEELSEIRDLRSR